MPPGAPHQHFVGAGLVGAGLNDAISVPTELLRCVSIGWAGLSGAARRNCKKFRQISAARMRHFGGFRPPPAIENRFHDCLQGLESLSGRPANCKKFRRNRAALSGPARFEQGLGCDSRGGPGRPKSPRRVGRGGVIRTRDPLLPKQMRYQAALRPESRRAVTARALHHAPRGHKTDPPPRGL